MAKNQLRVARLSLKPSQIGALLGVEFSEDGKLIGEPTSSSPNDELVACDETTVIPSFHASISKSLFESTYFEDATTQTITTGTASQRSQTPMVPSFHASIPKSLFDSTHSFEDVTMQTFTSDAASERPPTTSFHASVSKTLFGSTSFADATMQTITSESSHTIQPTTTAGNEQQGAQPTIISTANNKDYIIPTAGNEEQGAQPIIITTANNKDYIIPTAGNEEQGAQPIIITTVNNKDYIIPTAGNEEQRAQPITTVTTAGNAAPVLSVVAANRRSDVAPATRFSLDARTSTRRTASTFSAQERDPQKRLSSRYSLYVAPSYGASRRSVISQRILEESVDETTASSNNTTQSSSSKRSMTPCPSGVTCIVPKAVELRMPAAVNANRHSSPRPADRYADFFVADFQAPSPPPPPAVESIQPAAAAPATTTIVSAEAETILSSSSLSVVDEPKESATSATSTAPKPAMKRAHAHPTGAMTTTARQSIALREILVNYETPPSASRRKFVTFNNTAESVRGASVMPPRFSLLPQYITDESGDGDALMSPSAKQIILRRRRASETSSRAPHLGVSPAIVGAKSAHASPKRTSLIGSRRSSAITTSNNTTTSAERGKKPTSRWDVDDEPFIGSLDDGSFTTRQSRDSYFSDLGDMSPIKSATPRGANASSRYSADSSVAASSPLSTRQRASRGRVATIDEHSAHECYGDSLFYKNMVHELSQDFESMELSVEESENVPPRGQLLENSIFTTGANDLSFHIDYFDTAQESEEAEDESQMHFVDDIDNTMMDASAEIMSQGGGDASTLMTNAPRDSCASCGPSRTHVVLSCEVAHDSPVYVLAPPKILSHNPNSPSLDCGLRRSTRNRLPRLNVMQRPIYEPDEQGNLNLVGVSEAVVRDNMLKKHLVGDPVLAAEKEMELKKRKRLEQQKKKILKSRQHVDDEDVDEN